MVIFVIVGLVVGGALGLLISRTVGPPGQAHTFADLQGNAKEEYIVLVAAAYHVDHNLDRARARLERLEAPNVQHWVANLADRWLADERDSKDTLALAELAHGLGVESRPVLAYLAALTPRPTDTPVPTDTPSPGPTPAPTGTPTAAASPPAEEPTATPQPPATDTPLPVPSETPEPSPTRTPLPQPTNTARPQPSNTPRPANTPAAKWAWTARLVGPGQEGQSCAEGLKLIRVIVLNAAGEQIPGVWLYEKYTGQYRVSGHKGDDPYWGPGEAEFNELDGGQLCIAAGEGGACESDLTRNLPCHDPPPFEDLWAAGYCDCLEAGITQETCRERYDSGQWQPISHYAWRVEFRRSE
jgi:hypothetical protein